MPVRSLYDFEIGEARRVFGDALHYDRVQVHENSNWTDALDVLGRRLKGLPAMGTLDHNAVTLGYNCYFPVTLPASLIPLGQPLDYCMPWLIHELTHAWQFEKMGWGYVIRALSAQLNLKGAAYDFGPFDQLISRRSQGATLSSFNPEQQGNITRAYYEALRRGDAQAERACALYVGDINPNLSPAFNV